MSQDFGLGFAFIAGEVSVAQTSAGTTQATATALVANAVMVPSVTEGDGVLLPALQPREVRFVANGDTADALKVYPASGVAINGAAVNVALSVGPGKGAMFIGATNTKVIAIYG